MGALAPSRGSGRVREVESSQGLKEVGGEEGVVQKL